MFYAKTVLWSCYVSCPVFGDFGDFGDKLLYNV